MTGYRIGKYQQEIEMWVLRRGTPYLSFALYPSKGWTPKHPGLAAVPVTWQIAIV